MGALDARVAGFSVNDFYYLARTTLVKDERYFDRFDQVFGDHFRGQETIFDEFIGEIPLEWLRKKKELDLTDEEKADLAAIRAGDGI